MGLKASNGANLNDVSDEMCDMLVKYGFKEIYCSIYGASQPVYEIYRRGGNFDKVIDNIKAINKYKKIYRSEFSVLKWQLVLFGHNMHELKKARKLASGLGMEFVLKGSWDGDYSTVTDESAFRKVLCADARSFNYQYHRSFICRSYGIILRSTGKANCSAAV